MGSVYRVEDTTSGAIVALKQIEMLSKQGRSIERAELRFRREFHTLAGLDHPRIVQVHEFGEDPGGVFYTMELLDGQDLKDVGQVPWRRCCEILRDVLSALALLHARSLIHRDVAPRNVRLSTSGHAKLFDFGLLATVGLTGEVAGTPTCIAPENLRGLPLDDRSDLYAVGTLAYWMLTGRYPYQARELAELERLWRRPAAAVDTLVPDVPPQLSELVGRLLYLDPLGRPANAAEVIDRLIAVADLPEDADLEVRHGYLASAAMVGRQREMDVLRECVGHARAGKGRALFVQAPSGIGKSRLIREFALASQLAGMTTLVTEADSDRWDSYGVVRQLVSASLEARPAEAAQLPLALRSTIARVFPALRDRLGTVEEIVPVAEPAEERMRMQTALASWLQALSRTRPLAIFVDDVQRCDEASAAVLASLARSAGEHPILVVTALRTAEPIRAAGAVTSLQEADLNLSLGGLTVEEVEELVRSLFGETRHLGRLAVWLHRQSGGSPLHCTELARSLVDDGAARFIGGAWVLPTELSESTVPPELIAAMDNRIARLGEDAQSLARALAVCGTEFDLGQVRAMAEGLTPEAMFGGLDELVVESVLVGDGDQYRFRHDGLKEAVLRTAEDEQLATLHLRVGRLLQSERESNERDAEIGWHLRAGGCDREAADYLADAGELLFDVQALSDCIAPLEAAVEIYERHELSSARRLRIQATLVSAGWISDREAALRHVDPAVHGLRFHAGVSTAAALSPYLGRHLALGIGFSWAFLRWVFSSRARRGPSPLEAMTAFALTIGYACGLEYANHSSERLDYLVGLTEPIGVFRKRVLYSAYLVASCFPDLLRGRLGIAKQKFEQSLDIVANDRLSPMSDFQTRFATAGIRSVMAQIQVTNLDLELQPNLEAMREANLRYYRLVADTTEVVNLRFRGDERKARALEAELEAATVQLGSWSTDILSVLFSHPAYGLCSDVMGLKRMVDALERLCEQGFGFQARRSLTRGEYHRSRGEVEDAMDHLREAADLLPPDEFLTRVWVYAAMADTQLDAGDPEQAKMFAERSLKRASTPPYVQESVVIRASRALALAEAELGDVKGATERIESAIDRARALQAAASTGLCHEARARIAWNSGDAPGYRLHSAEANRWLRPTGNPALIAFSERLAELSAEPAETAKVDAEFIADSTTTVTRTPEPMHTAAESDFPVHEDTFSDS